MGALPLDPQTGYLAAIVLLAIPLLALRTARRMRGAPVPAAPRGELGRLIMQAVLLFVSVFVAWQHGVSLFSMPKAPGAAVLYGLCGLATVTALQWLCWVGRTDAARRAMWVRQILPNDGRSLARWIGIQLVAGTAEEALYRGVLFGVMATVTGSAAAAALITAVAFALAHVAQGARSMALIGVIGLVLQALVVVTGSLIPAMAVHAAANIVAGVRGPRRFAALDAEAAR